MGARVLVTAMREAPEVRAHFPGRRPK